MDSASTVNDVLLPFLPGCVKFLWYPCKNGSLNLPVTYHHNMLCAHTVNNIRLKVYRNLLYTIFGKHSDEARKLVL